MGRLMKEFFSGSENFLRRIRPDYFTQRCLRLFRHLFTFILVIPVCLVTVSGKCVPDQNTHEDYTPLHQLTGFILAAILR